LAQARASPRHGASAAAGHLRPWRGTRPRVGARARPRRLGQIGSSLDAGDPDAAAPSPGCERVAARRARAWPLLPGAGGPATAAQGAAPVDALARSSDGGARARGPPARAGSVPRRCSGCQARARGCSASRRLVCLARRSRGVLPAGGLGPGGAAARPRPDRRARPARVARRGGGCAAHSPDGGHEASGLGASTRRRMRVYWRCHR
jgi:hypothetical protein